MTRRECGEWIAVTVGFLAAAVLCVLLTGQSLTGVGQPYNSYSLQARSWLEGRLDLKDGADLPWLELAIRDGKYYVSFPPFPSMVLLPFVMIFGVNTPDTLLAFAAAALACFHAVRLAQLLLPENIEKEAEIDLRPFAAAYKIAGGGIRNAVVWAIYESARLGRPLSREDLLHGVEREYQKMGKVFIPIR